MSDYRGQYAGAVAVLFLVLTWTSVALRVYVRAVMNKAFGIDDYLTLLSLALFSFYCAFVLDGVHYGTGRHLLDIEEGVNGSRTFVLGMKAWWIAEIGYVSCTTILKLSIGFFLLRVVLRKSQRIVIWVVLSIVTAYSCYYFALVIFQCRPLGYFWNRFDQLKVWEGSCVAAEVISASTYTHSILSCVADWTLGIVPVFLVWDLNMNPRTKISLALILAMGALGSTATIVRIPYIYQLTETTDFLFANVDVSIWSTVEPGIGITASSLACLRPLFNTFFSRSRLLGSSTYPTGGVGSNNWSSNPLSNRKGYLRSGPKLDTGGEELGMSDYKTNLSKGSGVHTTIQSVNDTKMNDQRETERDVSGMQKPRDTKPSDHEVNAVIDTLARVERYGSPIGRKATVVRGADGIWTTSNTIQDDDSSEEYGSPGIRRTTEISRTVDGRRDPYI